MYTKCNLSNATMNLYMRLICNKPVCFYKQWSCELCSWRGDGAARWAFGWATWRGGERRRSRTDKPQGWGMEQNQELVQEFGVSGIFPFKPRAASQRAIQ